MKHIILLVLSLLGGFFLGVTSDFVGKTQIGMKIKNWKLEKYAKFSSIMHCFRAVLEACIGLFGPLILYILIFPADYPLGKVFEPGYVIACIIVSGIVGKIIGSLL